MKGNRTYMDIGSILDEVFDAAKDFGQKMTEEFGAEGSPDARERFRHGWYDSTGKDENPDYYPSYSYPPMNIYLTPERSLVFEFALSGFEERDISLTFQGDYMVFAAKIGEAELPEEGSRYIKRRLKLKDVEKQKYYAPADKFAQDKVKALFRNGILKVIVPPREEPELGDGIKIEIMKQGE